MLCAQGEAQVPIQALVAQLPLQPPADLLEEAENSPSTWPPLPTHEGDPAKLLALAQRRPSHDSHLGNEAADRSLSLCHLTFK